MIQFFNLDDMLNELKKQIIKPVIRIQGTRHTVTTTNELAKGLPICEFDIYVTSKVDDEIWVFIKHLGQTMIFEMDDINDRIDEEKKEEDEIKKKFIDFRVEKGMWTDDLK